MGFVEEIKENGWIKLIDDNVSFIDSFIIYGEFLVEEINKSLLINNTDNNEENKYYKTTIMLLLIEAIGVLDGIKSLFKGQSIDISTNLIRSLLELTIYGIYITNNKEMAQRNAVAYDINNIKSRIKNYEKLYHLTKEAKYEKAKENLLLILTKYPIYKEVKEAWDNKGGKKIKWYKVYSKSNNFRSLCKELNLEDVYDTYSLFSNKIHASSATDNVYINSKGEAFIKNPKIPFYASEILECIHQITSSLYINFVVFFLEDLNKINYIEWDKCALREKQLLQER